MDRAILAYYAAPGPLTDLKRHAAALADLPTDIERLVAVVRGLLRPTTEAGAHSGKPQIRAADRLLTLCPGPMTTPRPADQRRAGHSRDFAVLLCALLRHLGAPARVRCGYATYREAAPYVEQWICEVWHPTAGRWFMIDAQPEARQHGVDPLNLPPGAFWPAGRAWLTVRAGEADLEDFDAPGKEGDRFLHGNVVRDVLALNKVELLPGDARGIMHRAVQALTDAELDWLDEMATLSAAVHAAFDQLRAHFDADPRLAPLKTWAPVHEEDLSHHA